MEQQILLSIVIPAYNVEKYIEHCLESIYSQGKDESLFEVIVVNDGSKDKTGEIAKSILGKHSNSQYTEQLNQGQSVARNNGFALAKGKYVWFVDSDDWLKEDAFNTVWPILESNKFDIVVMPLEWYYPDTTKNELDIKIKEDFTIKGIDYTKKKYPLAPIQRDLISVEFLKRNNISWMPNVLHEDGLYGREIFYLAKSVYVMKDSYYSYRQQGESVMHNIKIRSAWDIITIHKEIIKFYNKRVKQEDKLWFRTEQTHLLLDCISFTYALRGTEEFKDFLKATRKYRRNQCLVCLRGNSLKNMIKLIAKALCPIIYMRIDHFVGKFIRDH